MRKRRIAVLTNIAQKSGVAVAPGLQGRSVAGEPGGQMGPEDRAAATAAHQDSGGSDPASSAGRVEAVLAPDLAAAGFRLLDAEYRQEGRMVLRLTVDRLHADGSTGGVTLDECAEASELASRLLDVADPIPTEYEMEVSSPGVFRKLSKPKHFHQSVGQILRVKLEADAVFNPGQYVLRGELTGVESGPEGETLLLSVEEGPLRIPLSGVKEARLDPDLRVDLHRG